MKILQIAQSDNSFDAEVNIVLDYRHTNSNIDVQVSDTYKTVLVKFEIEPEYRSWGIKDVFIHIPPQMIETSIMIDDMSIENGVPQEKRLVIDMSKVKQIKERVGRITLGEMEVSLDQNLNVNYADTSIVVYSL